MDYLLGGLGMRKSAARTRLVALLAAVGFSAGCSSEQTVTERLGVVESAVTPTFTDKTVESGIGVNTGNGVWPGHGSWAGVWVDLEGDGDLDVFTLGHLQPALCGDNQFWRNKGDGTFEDATIAIGMNDRDGADEDDPDCADGGTVEDGAGNAIFNQNETNSCTDGWDNGHRIDTHGAMWGDFDRDQDLDFIQVNESITGQPWLFNEFWRNDGSDFTEITSDAGLVGEDHITRGGAVVDYNRDGWLDIFMVTWQAQLPNQDFDFSPNNLLFRNDGNLKFTDVAITAGINGPLGPACTKPGQADASCGYSGVCALDGHCATKRRTGTWFDYDNDGWQDLFMNPPCVLYRNKGDGTFEDTTAAVGIDSTDQCQGAEVADYDNDGDLDIYSTRGFNSDVSDVLFRNDIATDGVFTNVSVAAGIDNTEAARAVTWGDYDNDGDEDIYVVTFDKPNTGNRLFQNNGNGTFTNVSVAAAVEAKVQGLGCFLDPMVDTQQPDYCANCVPVVGQTKAGGSDASWVDYDGDGALDLFVTNGEGNCRGPFVLLKNGGNANHWLKLELRGTIGNFEAIGARVVVRSGGVDRHYVYTGQHHFMAQNKVPLHVGLGAETAVELVTVTWPNGLVEQFDSIIADQVNVLVEGSNGGGSGGTGGASGTAGEGGTGASTSSSGGASGANAGGVAGEPSQGGSGEAGAPQAGGVAGVGAAGGEPATTAGAGGNDSGQGASMGAGGNPAAGQDSGGRNGGNDAAAGGVAGGEEGGSGNEEDAGCSCGVAKQHSPAGALAGLLLAGALLLRRRRA